MPVIGEYSKMYKVLNIKQNDGLWWEQSNFVNISDLLRFDDEERVFVKSRYRNGDVLIDGLEVRRY